MKNRLIVLAFALVAATGSRTSRTQQPPFADFVEPGFPFIVSTVDAGKLGASFPERNLAVRCVILMLGNESYACSDTDLLRIAAAWRGDFVWLTTMAHISYQQAGNKNNAIPRVLGKPVVATGVYPGWTSTEPDFRDPRPQTPIPLPWDVDPFRHRKHGGMASLSPVRRQCFRTPSRARTSVSRSAAFSRRAKWEFRDRFRWARQRSRSHSWWLSFPPAAPPTSAAISHA